MDKVQNDPKIREQLIKIIESDQGKTNSLAKANAMQALNRARIAYPIPLSQFPIGCKVKVKTKKQVLLEYAIAGRSDYFDYMDPYNEQEGVVDCLHATNGIRVLFPDTQSLWYEPECLEKLDDKVDDSGHNIERLFCGQKVRFKAWNSNNEERVGTIGLHFNKDYSQITVHYTTNTYYFKPEDVKKEKTFFGGEESGQVYPTSLDDYPIGSIVKVKAKAEVLKVFEFIGRQDYIKDMDPYFGKQGKVIALHSTNGATVEFEDGEVFWYEPGCLEIIQKGLGSVTLPRFPPNSLVRVKDETSHYYDTIGQVQLQFDPDSSKVAVLMGGQDLQAFESQNLESANYFFQNETSELQ